MVRDQRDSAAFCRGGHFGPVRNKGQNLTFGLFRVIAQKFGRAMLIGQIIPNCGICRFARPRPCGARLGLLGLHRLVKPVCIDLAALFAQSVLGQIQRKAICVIKFERSLTCQSGPFGQINKGLVQQFEPTIKRGAEAFFLKLKRLGDQRLSAAKLGIGLPHLADQSRHEAIHQRVLRAQKMGVAHRAAHDAAQHIPPPLV